jgi:hypothetical protein
MRKIHPGFIALAVLLGPATLILAHQKITEYSQLCDDMCFQRSRIFTPAVAPGSKDGAIIEGKDDCSTSDSPDHVSRQELTTISAHVWCTQKSL